MAKTLAEIIAETQAEATAKQDEGKNKYGGAAMGANAAISSFLQTMSGGLSDYVETFARNRKLQDGQKPFTVDDTREDLQKLFDYHSGVTAPARWAGHVAQWSPAGRVIGGIGKGAQAAGAAAPKIAAAGKWLKETMAAPGAVGGLKSGAITGLGLGTAKEAGRQLDRLGSEKSAAEEFRPVQSLVNVGVDTLAGATGGYVGGQLAQVLPGGQIAKTATAPFSERYMNAARAAEAQGAQMGTGPLAGHELARVIADPALRAEGMNAASLLQGLSETASRNMTPKRLPAEIAQEEARSVAAGPRSFDSQRAAAQRDVRNADAATRPHDTQTLTPDAEAIVHATPGMAAARNAQVAAARNMNYNAGAGPRAAVNAANPTQTPAVLRQLERESTDPAIVAAAERALTEQTRLNTRGNPKPGGGEFAQWYAAQRALQPYQHFWDNLGRGHSTPPAQPSPSIGASLQGGVAGVGKDILLILRNIAEGAAHRGAGVKNITQPGSQTLGQVGHRTLLQKGGDPAINALLQMMTSRHATND